MLVDLVDQGDAGVPLPESNLVGTDRADSGKIPVGQSPSDGHGHGLVHHVSCGLERLGRLGPGESLGPSGQMPGVRLGSADSWDSPEASREGFPPERRTRNTPLAEVHKPA